MPDSSRLIGHGLSWLVAALALLTVVRAPAYPLWIAAIFISEYGHLLAVGTLLLFFWRPTHLGWIVATLSLLIPIVQARPLASRLPAELTAAFVSPISVPSLSVVTSSSTPTRQP